MKKEESVLPWGNHTDTVVEAVGERRAGEGDRRVYSRIHLGTVFQCLDFMIRS